MPTMQRSVIRYREGSPCFSEDAVLSESPLEIEVNGVPWAALMCTPGSDEDLAVGFCLTEGLMRPDEAYAVNGYQPAADGMRLSLAVAGGTPRIIRALQGRGMRIGASCCGNRSATRTGELVRDIRTVPGGYRISPDTLHDLQTESEACQALFTATGATHFCALYGAGPTLIAYAEDVGRHNALDKAAGQAFRRGQYEQIRLVLLSSRLSFEMVQKAAALNAQVVAGFSAVTSRAVELADACEMTLVGFLRRGRMNIYTHPHRLGLTAPERPGRAGSSVFPAPPVPEKYS